MDEERLTSQPREVSCHVCVVQKDNDPGVFLPRTSNVACVVPMGRVSDPIVTERRGVQAKVRRGEKGESPTQQNRTTEKGF